MDMRKTIWPYSFERSMPLPNAFSFCLEEKGMVFIEPGFLNCGLV